MALLERLPAHLAENALDEFVRLIDAGGLYQQTAAIFAAATPAVQTRIVEHLATAGPLPRQIFADTLYDRGLDIKIPNTETPAVKPWKDGTVSVKLPEVETTSTRP